MNRLIIESLEGRLTLGITMFVAIMILIGWIAINEPARMASFQEQFHGRAIEIGAELYARNCAGCHGPEGFGSARAPALNNPQLFGVNFTKDVNDQIASIQRQIRDKVAEIDAGIGDTAALQAEVDTLYEEVQPLLEERDAILGQFSTALVKGYLPDLEEMQNAVVEGEILTELALTEYITTDSSRLSQIAWGGGLEGYIVTTLIHGRPGSNDVWPGPMVAWAQTGGGPLREDQVEDIAAYILNFDQGGDWGIDDLNAVNQFAKLHADASLVGEAETVAEVTGPPDISALPEGNAANGQTLYATCAGCHVGGTVGPDTAGTWARIESERLTLDQFAGYSVEQYVYESITNPGTFVPEGFTPNVMPANFRDLLSDQDIADIMAYLAEQ